MICSIIYGQTGNQIIITKTPKTVPSNKKWVLEAGAKTRIQVGDGVLNSGSLCNAIFLSNPRMIGSISRGTIFESEQYVIIFKDLEKVPYTNEYTFDLTTISFLDKTQSVNDLQSKKAEEVGLQKVEFFAGETVFVGKCLESIELSEIDMSQTELQLRNKIKEDANKANEVILSNFQIPVNPEKYVEPGTKPEIHDKLLENIVFTSPSVLFKQPGKGFAVDGVSIWTINLTATELNLKSSNGVNKTYSVINMEYDEKMKMQKIILGNSNKEPTHYLLTSWSNSRNEYSLILNSSDKSEEYQFQEVSSTEKQFQN